jgi:hypothetical protein
MVGVDHCWALSFRTTEDGPRWVKRLLNVYTVRDGLKGDQIFHVFEDSKGTIWISTRDQDRQLGFAPGSGAPGLSLFFRADGFHPKGRLAFAEDQQGRCVGMVDGGVLRYAQGRSAKSQQGWRPAS